MPEQSTYVDRMLQRVALSFGSSPLALQQMQPGKIRHRAFAESHPRIIFVMYENVSYKDYFNRELHGREKAHAHLPINEIVWKNDSLLAFAEPRLDCLSSQIHDNTIQVLEIAARLRRFKQDSLRNVSTKCYFDIMLSLLEERLDSLRISSPEIREKINYCFDIAVGLKSILVGYAHGDFSWDNIVITSHGKRLLIDWERFGEKSIFYDFFIMRYKLRHSLEKEDPFWGKLALALGMDKSWMAKDNSLSAVCLLELLLFQLQNRYLTPTSVDYAFLDKWKELCNLYTARA